MFLSNFQSIPNMNHYRGSWYRIYIPSWTTVPLNCNFIFPCMILCGTTTILQCIPVKCLHGPRLLMSCNVHVLWNYTRGSTCLVEVNVWKYTSCGSTCVEVRAWRAYACNKTHIFTRKNLLIESIELHYTYILLVDQRNVMYGCFSSAHIKSWWISSGARKFRVKYTVVFLIKLMGLVMNLNNFIVWRTCTRWTGKEMASGCSVRTVRYICLFGSCLMHEQCGLLNVCYYEWLYHRQRFAPSIIYGYTHAIVVNLFVLSYKPCLDQSSCTWYASWHFTSRGISHLVVLHVLCYSMSRATPRLVKTKISMKNFWILHVNICM